MIVELSWKTIKDYLESEGVIDLVTPKAVIRAALAAQIILDGDGWMEAIRNCNITSHIYIPIIAF